MEVKCHVAGRGGVYVSERDQVRAHNSSELDRSSFTPAEGLTSGEREGKRELRSGEGKEFPLERRRQRATRGRIEVMIRVSFGRGRGDRRWRGGIRWWIRWLHAAAAAIGRCHCARERSGAGRDGERSRDYVAGLHWL